VAILSFGVCARRGMKGEVVKKGKKKKFTKLGLKM
jgi:hypothetical protein